MIIIGTRRSWLWQSYFACCTALSVSWEWVNEWMTFNKVAHLTVMRLTFSIYDLLQNIYVSCLWGEKKIILFNQITFKTNNLVKRFFVNAFLICLAGVIVITAVLNRFRLHRMNKVEQFIMSYGGLRGAVAFALVLVINEEVIPTRKMMVTTIIAVVYFTVFLQGTTATLHDSFNSAFNSSFNSTWAQTRWLMTPLCLFRNDSWLPSQNIERSES